LMGFLPAGPLVAHPFVENAQGEKLLVQPVLLEGDAFNHAMNALSIACVEYSDDARVFELRNIRSLMRRASVRKPVAHAPIPAGIHVGGAIEAVD